MNWTALNMNMTLDLTSIACNVALGYRHPFNLTSVHDIEQDYKMLGLFHISGGRFKESNRTTRCWDCFLLRAVGLRMSGR